MTQSDVIYNTMMFYVFVSIHHGERTVMEHGGCLNGGAFSFFRKIGLI